MSGPDINFRNIRKHRSSQNDGFEELTRQLVLADPPADHVSIENRGPGADGGVEIVVRFQDGSVWGWQTKYFPDAFGSAEVGQLKKSFAAALANFPKLKRYYVAVPRNLSGHAEGKRDTQTKNWNAFKTWCAGEAAKEQREVEIYLWDESYFVSRLQRNDPLHAGMLSYWFNETVFDAAWFEKIFRKSLQFIGKRYRPEDHVAVKIDSFTSVLRRNEAFFKRCSAVLKRLSGAISSLQTLLEYPDIGELKPLATELKATLETLKDELAKVHPGDLYASELSAHLGTLARIRSGNAAFRSLREAEYARKKNVDPDTGKETWSYVYKEGLRSKISNFVELVTDAATEFNRIEALLLTRPVLLIEGEAGIGKSHLLANQVEAHLTSGGPALFVPARVLDHGDKAEQELLQYLDIADIRFETFLGVLQSAALAAGQPALLMIDGINESRYAKGWEPGLPSLLAQFEKFDRIALGVSVRTSYRELCIRQGLGIATITHHGFRGHLGEAAREYLDRHGIDRPSAPIFGLNEILYNPLFLSTAVDFMQATSQTAFPRGLDSIATLIKFWLEAVERNIVGKRFDRITLRDGKIPRVMQKLAMEMANAGSEYIPYEQAHGICEDIVGLAPPAKDSERLLSRLIDEGILLDTPFAEDETGKRISFGFQKFGDFYVADAILRACGNKDETLAKELREGGRYSYLFDHERFRQFAGPRVALMALMPQRVGCEIASLDDTFLGDVGISIHEFLASLLWREASSITDETAELLEHLRSREEGEEPQVDDDQWYDLLVQLAPLPNCLLNAAYLKKNLGSMPLAERDASWSAYLVGKFSSYDDDDWPAVQQLVDWAWTAPKADVERDKVHQVAIILTLMTSTTDRMLRDCATKALASLLMKFPSEMPAIVKEFADWDDTYVRERVLAAVAGAILYCTDVETIRFSAIAADSMVFNRQPVERHAWTRRFAQIIVNHAAINVPDLDRDLVDRSKPPYPSDPITDWPTLSDLVPLQDQARSIFSSVIGFVGANFKGQRPMMAGDFGRYTMGGIDNSFSEVTRGPFPPLRRKDAIDQFWGEVEKLGSIEHAAKDKLLEAAKLLQAQETSALFKSLGHTKNVITDEEFDSPSDEHDLKQAFVEAENALVGILPPALAVSYDQLKPVDRFREGEVPKFDLLQGQCWVFNRCLELGWQQDLHEDVEGNILRSHGRTDHRVERIGKKYQHIAFGELIGYLQDHHWYIDWDKKPEVLAALEHFQRADIDPTYLSGTYSKPLEQFLPDGICLPEMSFSPETAQRNIAWAKTLADIPEPTQYFVQSDPNGGEWCLLRGFRRSKDYMNGFETSEPFKGAQYSIELLMVPNGELATIAELTTGRVREDEGDLFEHGWTSPSLLGQRSFTHLAGTPAFTTTYQTAHFSFGRLTDNFSPKYSEYDQSGVLEASGFSTPHRALLTEFKLRPKSAWAGYFVTESDMPVFSDNPEFMGGVTVIRRDILEQFSKSRELTPVWRVWVEKDGGLGTGHGRTDHTQFARHDFVGFYHKSGDRWEGKLIPFRS